MSGSSSRSDSERRKDKRVSLVHEIECEGEGGIFRKRVADISFGGMFIDTLTSFAPGSVIKVRFRLPGSDLPTEVNAKILYVQEKIGTGASRTEGEVGIQCRGLALALGFNFP